jgi:MFS family permease
VVNGYLLTFGGFLLLGGRLGDLFGPRGLFLGGIVLFTLASLASLACGASTSEGTLGDRRCRVSSISCPHTRTIYEWGDGREPFARWLNAFYDLVETSS